MNTDVKTDVKRIEAEANDLIDAVYDLSRPYGEPMLMNTVAGIPDAHNVLKADMERFCNHDYGLSIEGENHESPTGIYEIKGSNECLVIKWMKEDRALLFWVTKTKAITDWQKFIHWQVVCGLDYGKK